VRCIACLGSTPALLSSSTGQLARSSRLRRIIHGSNALVCEPGADCKRVLERVVETDDLVQLAVWACGPDQVAISVEAGFTNLIATVPAMSMELDHVEADGCASEPIALAEAGALSDAAYGNKAREVERTLARIPTDRVQARGRRDATGQIVTAALALDVDDDCSVQYVATRADAQRRGHGLALLTDLLARAERSGGQESRQDGVVRRDVSQPGFALDARPVPRGRRKGGTVGASSAP